MALRKAHTATLTGLIIPAAWSAEQEVIAVALATADEKEYRVAGNRKGRELLGYLQRQAEVTGPLSGNGEGGMLITVRRYIVK
jgi:hypothetical protein